MKSTKALAAKIQAVSPESKPGTSWPKAIEGRNNNDSSATARGFFLVSMGFAEKGFYRESLSGGAEKVGVCFSPQMTKSTENVQFADLIEKWLHLELFQCTLKDQAITWASSAIFWACRESSAALNACS